MAAHRNREVPIDLKFAVSVAGFGMLLRDSPFKGSANFGMVERLARAGMGTDDGEYRREFVDLVASASRLEGQHIAKSP
jgi:Ca-activated chloride channel family protein